MSPVSSNQTLSTVTVTNPVWSVRLNRDVLVALGVAAVDVDLHGVDGAAVGAEFLPWSRRVSPLG